jgi:hypothetical protein
LREEAKAADVAPEVLFAPCLAAWELFEAGDVAGYHRAIAEHVRALSDVDAVVLAQASMAPAAGLLAGYAVPVLTSPRTAVERAVELVATGQ